MYEEQIADRVRSLAPEQQREILDFAEFLRTRHPVHDRPSMEGALEHLNIHLLEEDLEEVRREMWRNFPRDLDE